MPISPRAPPIGLPTLRDSSLASSSPCSSTSVASRRNSLARSAGATARQPGKASLARATAASVSPAPAAAISAIVSSVAGFRTAVTSEPLHELLEQALVLTGFGMPENPDDEPLLRVLEGLDDA